MASRRQTRLTALDLITYAAGDANPTTFLGCDEEYIHSIASTLNDASLRHTITFGIGLHHAGLTTKDRDVYVYEILMYLNCLHIGIVTNIIAFLIFTVWRNCFSMVTFRS